MIWFKRTMLSLKYWLPHCLIFLGLLSASGGAILMVSDYFSERDQVRQLLSSGAGMGDSNTPLVVVEFGDYQCAPCRRDYLALLQVLRENPHAIHLVFHHLPIINVHPRAMPCALISERASRSINWPRLHDRLMTGQLTWPSDNALYDSLRISRASLISRDLANKLIQRDLDLAYALHINSTPSLLLCKHNKIILRTDSVSSLTSYLATYTK